MTQASQVLAEQIANWLNGKLAQIQLMAETIDAGFSGERIQEVFQRPMLKNEFKLVFGGLDSDGKKISNDPSWNPPPTWDACKRPWYPVAKAASGVGLTDPYPDAASGEILISVVAKLTDKGAVKGAFGGDLSLKSVSDALNTATFNGAGYAFLLSADGKIISHPDAKLNGKSVAELFGGNAPALDGKVQEVEVNGQRLMVAFHPLSHLQPAKWLVGVVLDEDKVMAEARQIGWRGFWGAVIGVVLSMVILSTLMQQILRRPLQQLKHSLAELNSGNGDLTRRIDESSATNSAKWPVEPFHRLSAALDRRYPPDFHARPRWRGAERRGSAAEQRRGQPPAKGAGAIGGLHWPDGGGVRRDDIECRRGGRGRAAGA